ncbi:2-oxoadipate dioxygenase/decarboxylase HglS [Phyllobacterium bourgognense]|nr:VOC family protein [Phyllobacterium bourgognense]
MKSTSFVSTDAIRASFSSAMSSMYRTEVPAYGTLLSLVAKVNAQTLGASPELRHRLEKTDTLDRISEERHGAIRVGTAAELSMLRRVFAIMGMYPVGYYDLSEAGVPVHSTAFRPSSDAALKINPFRVFTSLLRLDLVADRELRDEARKILEARQIFTDEAISLIEKAEADGGLNVDDAALFVQEILETFRWHDHACVNTDLYYRLHDAHRLIADVVSFKGPHINHLTPRTLNIDAVQDLMPAHGISPKAVIEGPPTRACPILLRQTSFKALEENVSFRNTLGQWEAGSHTARFGEIEQRGIALTPKGRALYDQLLARSREVVRPAADGSNAEAYIAALAGAFNAFPDDWDDIRVNGLGYFRYSVVECFPLNTLSPREAANIETLIAMGAVQFDPIVYEDFLPVSAAGIFQSNLGDDASEKFAASPSQREFEDQLGVPVLDEFAHYESLEKASIDACLRHFKPIALAS